MSDFGDLRQFLDRDLTLTVDGKEYTIPAPNAEKGLDLRAWAAGGGMNDEDEVKAAVELCGGKWDDEKGDFVKPKGTVFARLMREQDWYTVYRVIKTGLIYYSVSRTYAMNYWRTGNMLDGDADLEESPPEQSNS